jgi:hypothetical protein
MDVGTALEFAGTALIFQHFSLNHLIRYELTFYYLPLTIQSFLLRFE